MPMLGSCQHRAMTCSRHASMPIRRLMLLALQSAEGSVPSDVLAGFMHGKSACYNCIHVQRYRTSNLVKPSLPLRRTCWLPRHCRCPIMVSANFLVRLFAPLHGSGLRLCDLLSTMSFLRAAVLRRAIWQEPGWCQPCRVVPSVRVGARALTLAPEPCPMLLCATAQLENYKVKEGPQCPQIHTPFTGLNWSH